MDLGIKPGRVNGLIRQFEELSRKPSSPEVVVQKLEPITEAVTVCMKFNTQLRQAQRVARFLAGIMSDENKEQQVQLVASMGLHTLMHHIKPVEGMMEHPLQKTRRWAMGDNAQRVHASGLQRALRSQMELAELQRSQARSQSHAGNHGDEPHQRAQTPYERKRLAKQGRHDEIQPKPQRKRAASPRVQALPRPVKN